MRKNIMSRAAVAVAVAAVVATPALALAPAASAAVLTDDVAVECVDRVVDGIEYICEEGVPAADEGADVIDRSQFARDVTPMPGQEIETGEGYQNIMPLGGDLPSIDDVTPMGDGVEIETGEGYQNIMPISIGIVPVSEEARGGLSPLAITGIVVGSAAVIAGGAALVLRNRKAAQPEA